MLEYVLGYIGLNVHNNFDSHIFTYIWNQSIIDLEFCDTLFCLKVLVTAQGCILEKVDIWIFGKWKWFWKNCSWISLFRAKWCLRCWMIQETVWSVKEYPISFDLEHISSKYMRISFTENAKKQPELKIALNYFQTWTKVWPWKLFSWSSNPIIILSCRQKPSW